MKVIFRACDKQGSVNGVPRPWEMDKKEVLDTCFRSLHLSLRDKPHEIHIIGDLIQSYDSIQEGEKIKVFTHFNRAEDFFAYIKADFDFCYFDSVEELQSINGEIKNSGEEVDRQIFQKFLSIPEEKFNKALKLADLLENIIGIHPVGSRLSNDFWQSVGKPPKILPPWFVRAMIVSFKPRFFETVKSKSKRCPLPSEMREQNSIFGAWTR